MLFACFHLKFLVFLRNMLMNAWKSWMSLDTDRLLRVLKLFVDSQCDSGRQETELETRLVISQHEEAIEPKTNEIE